MDNGIQQFPIWCSASPAAQACGLSQQLSCFASLSVQISYLQSIDVSQLELAVVLFLVTTIIWKQHLYEILPPLSLLPRSLSCFCLSITVSLLFFPFFTSLLSLHISFSHGLKFLRKVEQELPRQEKQRYLMCYYILNTKPSSTSFLVVQCSESIQNSSLPST